GRDVLARAGIPGAGRAQMGLAALDLELGARVARGVVAEAGAEQEVGLAADLRVTGEVLVEGEVHPGDEVEVEPSGVVEDLRRLRLRRQRWLERTFGARDRRAEHTDAQRDRPQHCPQPLHPHPYPPPGGLWTGASYTERSRRRNAGNGCAPCTARARHRSFRGSEEASMVGITAYGAYVPMLRLPLAALGGGQPKPGGPEKAVANWDEDAVTMGVA